jgi:hypothetical protein
MGMLNTIPFTKISLLLRYFVILMNRRFVNYLFVVSFSG